MLHYADAVSMSQGFPSRGGLGFVVGFLFATSYELRLSLTFDTVCTEADATQVVHSVPGAGARGRWEALRA